MRRPASVDPRLAALLREASRTEMTAEARERQIVSFAYGNAKLENDRVTRPLVADALKLTERR